jgi:hypothetical protein
MWQMTLAHRDRTATMSEKKRKRREENGERPTKKAATATAPQGTVQVEMVENKGDLGPILGMRRRSQLFQLA